ncbi:MAG: hypothetical protein JXR97_15405 [Planctomycetes bacterium]|nr:hypothetical protein [Planctomycetota bacterium]
MAVQIVFDTEEDTPLDDTNIDSSLDKTIDDILSRFEETSRLDHAHEKMITALHNRLTEHDITNGRGKMLEVNLFGSLSGWMEFILLEQREGRNVIPDFARHLRKAFLAHCRKLEVDPNTALNMTVELAKSLMDVAINFQRHMGLEDNDEGAEDSTPMQE